jgi:hypothetical protein
MALFQWYLPIRYSAYHDSHMFAEGYHSPNIDSRNLPSNSLRENNLALFMVYASDRIPTSIGSGMTRHQGGKKSIP